ncbi:MAG: ribonuclease J [Anaerolineae bacterium]|nr:ribonuclease J [Anaerolineae bacterium]MBN8619131.1 ribonuclease J [Anaerolineae bacterium]
MAKNPKLRIIPLGGLGEIGKNMTVFELGDDAIIVDTGIMFPANDMFGVDYIIPDFKYLTERKGLKIHGILYTHGHEDHVGATQHIVQTFPNVPIYATPLTAGLIGVKLEEARLEKTTTVKVFQAGDILKVGPFVVESYHVCHSIPDCVGFGINTPYGLVVHSGDYKFDNTPVDGKKPDYAKLAEFSRRGVLMLMADSTNADQPGWTPSESVIDGAFDAVFRQARGRIMVATFASLISRVHQVGKAAQVHGRKIAVAGHSMAKNIKMARDLGILNIPDEMFIDLNRINQVPDNKVVILVTGAQGEPSAVLGRLATGRHRQLDVREGDTIIVSSHTIPGNEEMVNRTINRLFQKGADVIYDPIAAVHVSGHARQEEMRLLINLTNPKYFMPVHGELRHLRAHGKLAMQAGIPANNIFIVENGFVLEADKNGVRVSERVPGGYVFVDGSGVGDIGPAVIRDRETLARDGFMMVVANVDAKSGELLDDPEIISRGFVYLRDATDLMATVKSTINEVLSNSNSRNGNRRDKLQESLGRVLYNETRRRPMIFAVINEQ